MRWFLLALVLLLCIPLTAQAQFANACCGGAGVGVGEQYIAAQPQVFGGGEIEWGRAQELVGRFRERQFQADQIVGENQAIRRYVCGALGCSQPQVFGGGFNTFAATAMYDRPVFERPFLAADRFEFDRSGFERPFLAADRFGVDRFGSVNPGIYSEQFVGFRRASDVNVNVNIMRERERRRFLGGGLFGGGCAGRSRGLSVNAYSSRGGGCF